MCTCAKIEAEYRLVLSQFPNNEVVCRHFAKFLQVAECDMRECALIDARAKHIMRTSELDDRDHSQALLGFPVNELARDNVVIPVNANAFLIQGAIAEEIVNDWTRVLVAKYPKVKLMEQEISHSGSRTWRDLDTVQGASAEEIVNDWTRVLIAKYPKVKLI
jgi:hypothetical protein